MNEVSFYKYKVLYKLKGAAKQVQEDWVCANLKELTDILKKQGVTKDSVAFMYVHQSVVGDKVNGVAEVIAIDNQGDNKTPAPVLQSNVIDLSAVRDRERTKPTPPAPPEVKPVTISSAFYVSLQV